MPVPTVWLASSSMARRPCGLFRFRSRDRRTISGPLRAVTLFGPLPVGRQPALRRLIDAAL